MLRDGLIIDVVYLWLTQLLVVVFVLNGILVLIELIGLIVQCINVIFYMVAGLLLFDGGLINCALTVVI